MILSILTPAVPSRMAQLAKLCDELARQIGGLAVEHLTLLDNKRRTVGEKRDALLRAARGAYVAFVDDDDWISRDYVAELVKAAQEGPDVITFRQHATVNETQGIITFGLGNPNEPFSSSTKILRNAWHVCAWRRTLAIQSRFPASNYGEDWAFAAPLCALPGLREVHIPKVLHYYRHSSETTEAPPP
jgi:glycosyltransferase involved in cell wall biosynthesis